MFAGKTIISYRSFLKERLIAYLDSGFIEVFVTINITCVSISGPFLASSAVFLIQLYQRVEKKEGQGL